MHASALLLAAIGILGLDACSNLAADHQNVALASHAANASETVAGHPAKVRALGPWGYSNRPFGE